MVRRVASNLGLLRHVRISNVWLITQPDGARVLIDTGHPVERPALRLELWRAGIRGPGDLEMVIVTHRHSDHAGNAAWLRKKFQCPVVCPAADAPYLSGAKEPERLVRRETPIWARALCHIEDAFPARCEVDDVLDNGVQRWGFRAFEVPGHTEGSMLLHHEGTGALVTGDAIIAGPPTFRLVEQPRLSFDAFSANGEKSRESVRSVVEQLPSSNILCSGHGPPITDDVDRKLRALAGRDWLWPRRAR